MHQTQAEENIEMQHYKCISQLPPRVNFYFKWFLKLLSISKRFLDAFEISISNGFQIDSQLAKGF